MGLGGILFMHSFKKQTLNSYYILSDFLEFIVIVKKLNKTKHMPTRKKKKNKSMNPLWKKGT